MNTAMIVISVMVLLVLGLAVWIYNSLIALKNRYQNAFAQIEVQLLRRYDLIPNLVSTAKAYMTHERETLEAVIAARNEALAGLKAASGQVGSQQSMRQLAGAEGALLGALGKMNMVMEAYPDLKASQNMMQLSEELKSTENKVSFARQHYNDSVTAYNQYRESFPAVLLAASFGHRNNAALLNFAERTEIQSAPKVQF